MRIEVGNKEHRLEIHEACIPDLRGTAQEREDHPREERLQPEEEERADERGYGEES
jgi:hypothetical protein